MVFVRFLLGVLIAIGALLLAVPAVVLVDLVAGGSGLGLCPDGLGTCTTSAFTIAELAVLLGFAAVIIGGGIALCLRILHGQENDAEIRLS
ncbi:MAG: hypothetical protein ACR2N2_12835 [Acidimicrobiia bacterium]